MKYRYALFKNKETVRNWIFILDTQEIDGIKYIIQKQERVSNMCRRQLESD